MRISYWSSDVCSSDLARGRAHRLDAGPGDVDALPGRVARAVGADELPLGGPTPAEGAGSGGRRRGRYGRPDERRVGTGVSVRVDLGGGRNLKRKAAMRLSGYQLTNHTGVGATQTQRTS